MEADKEIQIDADKEILGLSGSTSRNRKPSWSLSLASLLGAAIGLALIRLLFDYFSPGSSALLPVPGSARFTWQQYNAETEHFIAVFPSAPERTTEVLRLGDRDLEVVTYMAQERNAAYGSSFVRLLPEEALAALADPDNYIDSARDNMLALLNGKLLLDMKITHEGLKGREIHFLAEESGHKVKAVVRIFLTKRGFYQLGVFRPTDEGDPDRLDDRFLNSFRYNE